jgi:hypothetical protein
MNLGLQSGAPFVATYLQGTLIYFFVNVVSRTEVLLSQARYFGDF